ncbi:hypothetical protein G8O24_21040 [Bradyrhizobium sp. INPA01-394B]|uniref:IPTL-CTERM sorting domain-containing protein n=1 Tax=Bradyrhizobium campsiandrae TaxID=1729892 RepID=A0ABR7U5G9_9BRAD|nr:hypothetical protein [Bradyrhizobium campsiandrae]MBC9879829.1 hypothetical protein [Bradyrhizobium campsiandrae]MBC9978838.1 hypothetical protein [Bradyrhizobium campsiandrae]
MSYYFEVFAPQPRSITMDVTAAGGITGTGWLSAAGDLARSQLTIDPIQTSTAGGYTLVLGKYLSNGLFSTVDFNTSWSTTNQKFTVSTNKIYTVTLTAFVAADVYNGASASMTAFVDPTFNIDASNTDADQLQLVFSPNIGAVPELSTWAMMILGFCGLGFLAHSRHDGRTLAA